MLYSRRYKKKVWREEGEEKGRDDAEVDGTSFVLGRHYPNVILPLIVSFLVNLALRAVSRLYPFW